MALKPVPKLEIETAKSDTVSVDDLIRALLLRLSRDLPGLNPRESASEEILLDVHVDGRRYLFVRMPVAEPFAASLSPREQEIVRMVAKGYPTKIIADVLNISSWTVCTHLRRIFAKLGVASRTAMLARLMKEGWVWDRARADPDYSQPATGTMAAGSSTRELPPGLKQSAQTHYSRTNGAGGHAGVAPERCETERVL